jgi:hypothetical protein
MIQFHEHYLLYPRNPQLLGNLPQRPLFPASVQAEAADNNFLLAFIENIEIAVDLALLDLQIGFLNYIVDLRAEDGYRSRQFVALFIRTDGIVERHVLACLIKRPKVHQYLTFYTPCGKSRQLWPLVRAIALDGFDQANGADGDEILHIFTGIVEFFEDVNTK